MEVWEGKIKGYDQSGNYAGTYEAVVEKDGEWFYKMTLRFDSACARTKREINGNLKANLMSSSSLEVLKRNFRKAILLNVKSKITWKKKSFIS